VNEGEAYDFWVDGGQGEFFLLRGRKVGKEGLGRG
jgi:hypothetical protein